jgi:DNA-binding NarL/FixJ family response regulator
VQRVPFTVLVADDVAEVRTMIRTALQLRFTPDRVLEAGSGREAELLAAEHRPSVSVLDLNLQDTWGRETYRRVRRASPQTRMVIYAASDSDRAWYANRGIRFVSKSESLETLLSAVEQLRS